MQTDTPETTVIIKEQKDGWIEVYPSDHRFEGRWVRDPKLADTIAAFYRGLIAQGYTWHR